jgi:hypothetical protein
MFLVEFCDYFLFEKPLLCGHHSYENRKFLFYFFPAPTSDRAEADRNAYHRVDRQ